jgi:hypothetical protein
LMNLTWYMEQLTSWLRNYNLRKENEQVVIRSHFWRQEQPTISNR